MTLSSLLDKEEKEVANLCHSLVDLHGNFYYLTTLLFQRKNVGWASKKVSIAPAEGQVVFHHCRQHSRNFCSCSSSLDLRSLSFDLIYSNFKSSFLNFLLSLDSIFKLQVKLWNLDSSFWSRRLFIWIFVILGWVPLTHLSSIKYFWNPKTKKELSFFKAAYKQQNIWARYLPQ